MNRNDILDAARRLEQALGDPRSPDSPTGFAAARRSDESESFPDAGWQTLIDTNYFDALVPGSEDGEFTDLTHTLTHGRCIARRDLTLAVATGQCLLGALPVWIAGSDDQRRAQAAHLRRGNAACLALTEEAHGSDLAGGGARAIPQEGGLYRLEGTKWCINNATRGRTLTALLRTAEGDGARTQTLFWIDKDALEGPEPQPIPRLPTQGVRAADISGSKLDGVVVTESARIGREGRGLDVVARTLQVSRTLCAAFSLGAADTALRAATEFARARPLYGAPVFELPAVRRLLARAALNLTLADALAVAAARMSAVAPEQLGTLSAVVKIQVPQLAERVISDAKTVLGARHYLREGEYAHVEKLVRDAPLISLFDGSAEVNRHVLAGQLLAVARARKDERATRGEEIDARVAAAKDLDRALPPLDFGALRTNVRGRDDLCNAIESLPEGAPLRVARDRLDHDLIAAAEAGLSPRDARYFDLADDYVRLVTATAAHHFLPEGGANAPTETLVRAALSPAPFRTSDEPDAAAALVEELVRRVDAGLAFGSYAVELAR